MDHSDLFITMTAGVNPCVSLWQFGVCMCLSRVSTCMHGCMVAEEGVGCGMCASWGKNVIQLK